MKKAQISEGLIMFFTILVMAMFILAIIVVVKIKSHSRETEVKEFMYDIDFDQFMLTYLRTPAGYGNMADVFTMQYYNHDQEDFIVSETNSIIDATYGPGTYWLLDIGEDEIKNYNVVSSTYQIFSPTYFEKEISLPGYNGDVIELKMKVFK